MTPGFRSAKRFSRRVFSAGVFIAFGAAIISCATEKKSRATFGLDSRPPAKPYLQMPALADGALPRLLSQTGAFKDTADLAPDDALIPYDLIVPFWSDGAVKTRFISVPDEKIKFAPTGEWVFPRGTVFVKTFSLATNEMNPDSLRRLETRLLVCDSAGGVYGVTYKWRADNSDADLLETNLTEAISIQTATGIAHAAMVLSEPRGLPHLPHGQRRSGARRENAAVEPRFQLSVRRHRQRIARVEPHRLVRHKSGRGGLEKFSKTCRHQ